MPTAVAMLVSAFKFELTPEVRSRSVLHDCVCPHLSALEGCDTRYVCCACWAISGTSGIPFVASLCYVLA